METKKLKRLEIKNGQFTLEGSVINASPLRLSFIEFDPLTKAQGIEDCLFQQIIEESLPADFRAIHKASREADIRELNNFYDNANGANAYVLGEPIREHQSRGLGSFAGDDTYTYPILYLKLKE